MPVVIRKALSTQFLVPDSRNRVKCPHCHNPTAKYICDGTDVTLRCMCGYLKVVATKLQFGVTVEHRDTQDDISLPGRHTKLYRCLAELVGLQEASTGQVVLSLAIDGEQLSSSDVASHLTLLRYRSLVEVVEDRKGMKGGSVWKPTKHAMRLFKGV